jgi:hypothetical protein
MGIEPTSQRWKRRIMPLYHIRIGASEGNRTLVSGLGSPRSAIEPHSHTKNNRNWSTVRESNPLGQLGRLGHSQYANDAKLERAKGIEPSHGPWQGSRLPLHHARRGHP